MKKPGWLKDGIATEHGIITARGEMLKRRKMSEAQISEWNGFTKPAPVVEAVVDTTPEEVDLDSMTKAELENVGREHGIELDRREKKSSLIDVLKYIVK